MSMNREIKFRVWDKETNSWYDDSNQNLVINLDGTLTNCWNGELMEDYTERIILLPFTGLKDKNGVEIYEYSELDGDYEVIFKDLRYSLRYIPNNDIIDLQDYWRDKNGEIEVTREYTKV